MFHTEEEYEETFERVPWSGQICLPGIQENIKNTKGLKIPQGACAQ